MIHKFCDNHLAELYEAIKLGEIGEIEKIEHELTPAEECVACAYALKAKGTAREVLLNYLASEGVAIEFSQRTGFLAGFLFWIVRLGLFLVIFLPIFVILVQFSTILFAVIFSFLITIFAFTLINQFFEK